MRFIILLLFCFNSQANIAQPIDTSKWLRAFPITDYIVDVNDSAKVVQLQMPEDILIKEKTLGLLYGVYHNTKEETVEKGYGRCQLIKSNFYYFSIGQNKSGLAIKSGDLLYIQLPKTKIYYGYIPKLASHYIELTDVYDSSYYTPNHIFYSWSEKRDTELINAMLQDIQFTGNYFKQNNPAMDVEVKSGDYKGKSTLSLMINCTQKILRDFFDYVNARPRNYAGRKWKISEIFATWVSEGAPTVVTK